MLLKFVGLLKIFLVFQSCVFITLLVLTMFSSISREKLTIQVLQRDPKRASCNWEVEHRKVIRKDTNMIRQLRPWLQWNCEGAKRTSASSAVVSQTPNIVVLLCAPCLANNRRGIKLVSEGNKHTFSLVVICCYRKNRAYTRSHGKTMREQRIPSDKLPVMVVNNNRNVFGQLIMHSLKSSYPQADVFITLL